MSPLRHSSTAVAAPLSSAPGAWSPLATDLLRNMLDAVEMASTSGSDGCTALSPYPHAITTTNMHLETPWDVASFFSPSDTSLETFWEYPPALTRSASPASSDNNSSASMYADDLSMLLHDPAQPVAKVRGNSLSDMDEGMANAFLLHIAQQVVESSSQPEAASPTATATASEDMDAELQYHLRTLRPTPTLAQAPEPLYDDATPLGADDMPPRPPNAFILYRRHQQAHLRSERPGIHLHLASKLIAAWWKNESADTKEHYRQLASEGRKELLRRFPDYKYRARTDTAKALAKKRRKDRKTSADAVISAEHALYLQALSPYLCQ